MDQASLSGQNRQEQAMATIMGKLGEFIGYSGKILLPVVLGSLIFTGILAQYNNDMNLNKTILESYYQPMKEQSRLCLRLHADLEEKLATYRGDIDEIRRFIDHGVKPPPEVLKQPGDPAYPGPRRIVAIQQAWRDLDDCDQAFTGYLGDLSIMLGRAAAELDPLIERRNGRFDRIPLKKDAVIRQMHELDVGQLFIEMGQASPNQVMAMKPSWARSLKTASDRLGELIAIARESISANIGEIDEGSRIAAVALRRRFQAGPFDFIRGARP
jgi:hypothetical protein